MKSQNGVECQSYWENWQLNMQIYTACESRDLSSHVQWEDKSIKDFYDD